MKDNNEITSFGHRLPKEVYEDYKKIEEFKDQIKEAIEQSTLTDYMKDEILDTLSKMHRNFEALKKNKPRRSL